MIDPFAVIIFSQTAFFSVITITAIFTGNVGPGGIWNFRQKYLITLTDLFLYHFWNRRRITLKGTGASLFAEGARREAFDAVEAVAVPIHISVMNPVSILFENLLMAGFAIDNIFIMSCAIIDEGVNRQV
jgi:hypothetical protein